MQTAAEWSSHHRLRYHLYVLLSVTGLKDAVVFAHGTFFGLMAELKDLNSCEDGYIDEE